MTTATTENSRSIRYPAKLKVFAERAHARGHSIKQIKAALALKGYHPHWKTVAYWADPQHAEAHRIKERRRGRPDRESRHNPHRRARGWSLILSRMFELRRRSLSFRAIAQLLALDYGLELTDDQVRGILKGTTSRETVRKLLTVRISEEGVGL